MNPSSTARSSSPTTAPKPISTSATTSVSSINPATATATSAASTSRSSRRSAPAITTAAVQVIPHITNEIEAIRAVSGPVDVVIAEIGGTVGDIEACPSWKPSVRPRRSQSRECLPLPSRLYPHIKAAGEIKTSRPGTRCRNCARSVSSTSCSAAPKTAVERRARKLALFCNVDLDQVIELPDATHSI